VAAGTQYGYDQGTYVVANSFVQVQAEILPLVIALSENVTRSQVVEIPLAPDAAIQRASFVVGASAPIGSVPLGDVADVRAAAAESSSDKSAVVIDFGRLTSIAALGVGVTPYRYYRWNGTSWENEGSQISELGTERLLVEFENAVSASNIRADGSVRLPARPTGLELLVDGNVVWSEQQGGATPDPPVAGGGFVIDRTIELQEAVRRQRTTAPDPAAPVSVRVEFRTAYPGVLTLQPHIEVVRTHVVAFSTGSSRTIEREAEGPLAVDLPLPAASAGWRVSKVEVAARGSIPPERIQPAEGPTFSDSAKLLLTPDRTILVGVPDGLVGRFASITGFRFPLAGGPKGGEIGGRLLYGTGVPLAPGEPVEGAELTPVSVPSGEEATWTTLRFPGPVPSAGGPYWLEFIVSYGELELQLTENPEDDPLAPGALIHRRLAGGGTRPLTTIPEVGPLRSAIRAVGMPDPNSPISALTLNVGVAGSEGAADPDAAVGITPSGDGVPVQIGLPNPLLPAGDGMRLHGVVAYPGSYTFDRITLTYQESEEATP
jgi:hypothetical protein